MLDGTAVRIRLDRIQRADRIVARAASALSHSMVSSSPSYGIEFALFKQPRREAAQFGVVLDDQHRSTVLLGLSHIRPLPLSVRYSPHPIAA
jgi:hypothetical protein